MYKYNINQQYKYCICISNYTHITTMLTLSLQIYLLMLKHVDCESTKINFEENT